MRKTKSICFVITNDIATDQRIQRSVEALNTEGYHVTVFYRNKHSGIQRDINGCGIPMWFNSGPLFYLEFNIRAFFFLILNSFDVITSVDVDTISCCRIATWIKRKPLIFDAHEFFVYVPELLEHPLKQRVWTMIERLFIKNLSAAYTVNDTLADVFTNRYAIPFQAVRNVPSYNSSFIQETPKSLPESDPVILIYQGAINAGRGIELYIGVMDHLPNCELWLVGKGDLTGKIHEITQQSTSKNRIKLLGLIEPEKLMDLTTKAHIGLNMLDPTSKSYYYSLANRYYDYVKAGVPSIHMDFPEYRKAMDRHHTGVLVSDYDTKALLEAIQYLVADPERYREISFNCHSAIKENKWELEKGKLLSIYDSI